MANTKAYIQSLQNKDGDDVYPVTVGDAVYIQTTSGDTVTQTKLSSKLKEMETNFTDGCSTIVSALTELGVTPEATTPAGIAAAIKKMYEDRYNSGVEQGHKDVVADPAAYGLITEEKYNAYGEAQYNAGIAFADSRVNTSSASYSEGKEAGISYAISNLNGTSFGTVTTSADGENDYSGVRVRYACSASVTPTISNGTISLTLRVWGTIYGDDWDSGWTQDVSASYDHTKTRAFTLTRNDVT